MKRTKKELAERKANAAEIAAMYVAVASGKRLQEKITRPEPPYASLWIESEGPTLRSDLSLYRVIETTATKKKP